MRDLTTTVTREMAIARLREVSDECIQAADQLERYWNEKGTRTGWDKNKNRFKKYIQQIIWSEDFAWRDFINQFDGFNYEA